MIRNPTPTSKKCTPSHYWSPSEKQNLSKSSFGNIFWKCLAPFLWKKGWGYHYEWHSCKIFEMLRVNIFNVFTVWQGLTIRKMPYVITYVYQNFGVRNVHGQIQKSIYQASYLSRCGFSNNFSWVRFYLNRKKDYYHTDPPRINYLRKAQT